MNSRVNVIKANIKCFIYKKLYQLTVIKFQKLFKKFKEKKKKHLCSTSIIATLSSPIYCREKVSQCETLVPDFENGRRNHLWDLEANFAHR